MWVMSCHIALFYSKRRHLEKLSHCQSFGYDANWWTLDTKSLLAAGRGGGGGREGCNHSYLQLGGGDIIILTVLAAWGGCYHPYCICSCGKGGSTHPYLLLGGRGCYHPYCICSWGKGGILTLTCCLAGGDVIILIVFAAGGKGGSNHPYLLLGRRGCYHPYCICSWGKGGVTILTCCWAEGGLIILICILGEAHYCCAPWNRSGKRAKMWCENGRNFGELGIAQKIWD